jgi:hypothetical protein
MCLDSLDTTVSLSIEYRTYLIERESSSLPTAG